MIMLNTPKGDYHV